NPTLVRRARALRRHATDAERCLWRRLRLRQILCHRFRRQVPIAGYIADFACVESRLIVELDGGQHADAARYDRHRDTQLREAGFEVIRFWNHDVLLRTDEVLEQIVRALDAPRRSNALARTAGRDAMEMTRDAPRAYARGPHPGLPPQAGEGDKPARLAVSGPTQPEGAQPVRVDVI